MEAQDEKPRVATLGQCIKISGEIKLPKEYKEFLVENSVNKMLMIGMKESNVVILTPMSKKIVIKICVELNDISMSFQAEIGTDLADFNMKELYVEGLTSNEEGAIIYEGYFQTDEIVDITLLEKNIKANEEVDAVEITVYE